MMFDASRMWLASRGMEAMDGPINFGQRRDWWGLLVEGYEFQPLYKNPYNPPYYKELFENYGFKNYFNQHSFIWRANVSEASERIFDRAERLLSTPGYHVENIDMNQSGGRRREFPAGLQQGVGALFGCQAHDTGGGDADDEGHEADY